MARFPSAPTVALIVVFIMNAGIAFGQTAYDPGQFPAAWQMLTTRNNQKVIFNRCDGGNPAYEIRKGENLHYYVWVFSGQDAIDFEITSMIRKDNKFTIKCGGLNIFTVVMQDKDFKSALWSRSTGPGDEFVNNKYMANYKVVPQPCRECQSDEECSQEEKRIANKNKVPKVNELNSDKSLVDFITRLQTAINQKDKKFLLSVVDNDVENSGGQTGIEVFKSEWGLTDNSPGIWTALTKVISLGGVFIDAGKGRKNDKTGFVFPYLYAAELGDADPYTTLVVTGANVNVRSAPSKTGKIIGQLTYDIVTITTELPEPKVAGAPASDEWKWVMTLDKKMTGFVYSDFLYSPFDNRLFLTKKAGQWKITALVFGD